MRRPELLCQSFGSLVSVPVSRGDVFDSHRVVVAMSGGVDSSVVAAMLKKSGCDVIGVTMQLGNYAPGLHEICCDDRNVMDAERVAKLLGIQHYVLDCRESFHRLVVDYFVDAYARGETPIPCVACNRLVKFSELIAASSSFGGAILATGHYAVTSVANGGGRSLHRAFEERRDQSYFLYSTMREQLDTIRFPLGWMSKVKTRSLAKSFGLPVYDKTDSRGICFVQSGDYKEIIKHLKPHVLIPGNIVHVDGRILGEHSGIACFTVGQRRGIGVTSDEPLYVVKLDVASNSVIVGHKADLRVNRLYLREFNWLGDGVVDDWFLKKSTVLARVRSTAALYPAVLTFDEKFQPVIDLFHNEYGVACGQACVLYDDSASHQRVLGGGIIDQVAFA